MPQELAIGIDFGTSNSSVAVFQNGAVEIISNDFGSTLTPSIVAFTNTQRLIGSPAKIQASINPTNTIFDIKRLIDPPWSDHRFKTETKNWPFVVVNDNGKTKIKIEYKNETKYIWPEEICAMILSKMKEIAEAYLGKTVTKAVITVPCSFNYFQRLMLRDAATIAGLTVMRIISSSTAVAMTYNFSKKNRLEKNILVFDFGGGTTNVSIVAIQDGIVDVISTSGHIQLGGKDFDDRLINHFVQEFQEKHKKDLSSDKRALRCLKTASEKAKHTLSASAQANIEIDSLFEGVDFYTTITRAKFEEINADLFNSALDVVKKAVADAKLSTSQIQEVVLVGGSSRIPKIQTLLQGFFNGLELNKCYIYNDEVVVYGAAIQASVMQGRLKDLLIVDVTQFSLGIEDRNGAMTTVIKRNVQIPTRETYTLDTYTLIESKVEIKIYEGEHTRVADNTFLAKCELKNIPPSPQGRIEVTFDIDADNFLSVTVVEKNTKKRQKIHINDTYPISQKDKESMIYNAEKYRRDDENIKLATAAKTDLESYCARVKAKVEELGNNISYTRGLRVMDKCNRIMTWLEVTEYAVEVDEYRNKQKELETMHQSLTTPNANCLANDTSKMDEAPNFTQNEFYFEKMKCGNCSKYLSYFPVYIASDKLPICGRCSQVSQPRGFIRDTLFESLVDKLMFPCINYMEGCLENLSPLNVPNHEKSCRFRSVACPVSCKWQGIVNDLLQHFQEAHSDSILNNSSQFGLFFFASEHHYLFVYQEELFHFKQMFSKSKNMVECQFYCYHVHDPDIKYNYEIRLENGAGTRSFTFPSKSAENFSEENMTKILVEDIILKLDNPSTIAATITVTKEADNSEQDSKSKPSLEVNYDLLRELECPVCFNYIIPPIYQCTTGHSICAECKKQISSCPSCQAGYKNTQNFTLEKMACLLTYPCKFAEKGCSFTSRPEEMNSHYKSCVYIPQKCPLQDYHNCSWNDSAKNMLGHILDSHPSNLLGINTINVCVDSDYLKNEDSACYIISFSSKLFKIHYSYKKNIFKWAVQLVGSHERANNYKFEIEIIDNTKKDQKLYFRKLCSISDDTRIRVFDLGHDYIFVELGQIKSFLTDILTYRIRVVY